MKSFITLLVVILGGAFMTWMQQARIDAQRTELAGIEQSSARRQRESSSNVANANVSADEIARLRAETRDIHRLRAEITQARQKRKGLEQMRAENAGLKAKIELVKANPNAAAPNPFPLSNKGQATPEAALETTFWAMHQGDTQALSKLMPAVTAEFQRMPAEERTKMTTMLRVMAASIEKMEILEQRVAPEEAELKVKITRRQGMDFGISENREQSTFLLHRTNDLWQIVAER